MPRGTCDAGPGLFESTSDASVKIIQNKKRDTLAGISFWWELVDSNDHRTTIRLIFDLQTMKPRAFTVKFFTGKYAVFLL